MLLLVVLTGACVDSCKKHKHGLQGMMASKPSLSVFLPTCLLEGHDLGLWGSSIIAVHVLQVSRHACGGEESCNVWDTTAAAVLVLKHKPIHAVLTLSASKHVLARRHCRRHLVADSTHLVLVLQELQQGCLADGFAALLLPQHKRDDPLLHSTDDMTAAGACERELGMHTPDRALSHTRCQAVATTQLTRVALLAAAADFLCCCTPWV